MKNSGDQKKNLHKYLSIQFKVPKYLSETWSKADDSGIVGNLKISKYVLVLFYCLFLCCYVYACDYFSVFALLAFLPFRDNEIDQSLVTDFF